VGDSLPNCARSEKGSSTPIFFNACRQPRNQDVNTFSYHAVKVGMPVPMETIK
jgi:hypothetical protein